VDVGEHARPKRRFTSGPAQSSPAATPGPLEGAPELAVGLVKKLALKMQSMPRRFSDFALDLFGDLETQLRALDHTGTAIRVKVIGANGESGEEGGVNKNRCCVSGVRPASHDDEFLRSARRDSLKESERFQQLAEAPNA